MSGSQNMSTISKAAARDQSQWDASHTLLRLPARKPGEQHFAGVTPKRGTIDPDRGQAGRHFRAISLSPKPAWIIFLS